MDVKRSAYDFRMRKEISSVLMPGTDVGAAIGLPVQPLIEIIARYAFVYHSVTTTLVSKELSLPYGVYWDVHPKTGAKSIIIADTSNQAYRQFHYPYGRLELLSRPYSTRPGFSNGRMSESQFSYPMAGIRVDPLNPNRLYVCDYYSVRVIDRTGSGGLADATVSLIAGGGNGGYADGAGATATFNGATDLLVTSDGQRLIVTDYSNNRIRCVDVKTGVVSTIGGGGRTSTGLPEFNLPRYMAFDTKSEKPDTVLYLTCCNTIHEFNIATGESRGLNHKHNPWGIACLKTGMLIFSCSGTQSVYSLDPATGEDAVCLTNPPGASGGDGDGDGGGDAPYVFNTPTGICIDETAQCVIVVDRNNGAVRSVTLPPYLFDPNW